MQQPPVTFRGLDLRAFSFQVSVFCFLLYTLVSGIYGQGLPQNVPALASVINFNGGMDGLVTLGSPLAAAAAKNINGTTKTVVDQKAKTGTAAAANITRQDLTKMANGKPPSCSSVKVCSATF
ncbi:hypothetical protein BV898_00925 [Hypsibius exemplaris]|uniref:Uncharacterized protein n=1 Tax=Hypsibius exemplaris TaxID=2072580 RepID=A0A1W0XCM8_HYPEX|nr:hypothetical protein BV898_00925 [Hypsibius exemplaris]